MIRQRTCLATVSVRLAVELAHGRRLTGKVIELVDGLDAFPDHARRERAVFVVPAVRCTVTRRQVPLRQVDMLADDVGWRTDLEVVDLVLVRDQVGMQDLAAVKRIETHDERLRRTTLGDVIVNVAPQRNDSFLRIVVADLVEDGVDLDVGHPVGPRIETVEIRVTRRTQGPGIAVAVEPLACCR